MNEYGLTSPSEHCKGSLQRQAFPVSHLHWYWQSQPRYRTHTKTKNNTAKKWP